MTILLYDHPLSPYGQKVKNAMREIKHNGKDTGVAEDLHRMLEVAQDLRGNQTRAKVFLWVRNA